jgi:hypothetical protein
MPGINKKLVRGSKLAISLKTSIFLLAFARLSILSHLL